MTHRKIIYVTLKVVVDIDTNNIDAERTSDAYSEQVEEQVDNFISDMDYIIQSNDYGGVVSTEIIDHEVKI